MDRRNLPVLELGASAAVVVGDPVIAVGASLGLDSTVTSGIVSALNRAVTVGGAEGLDRLVHQRHPDRRGHQPGQLRRAVARYGGSCDRVNSAIARVTNSQNPVDGQSGNIGVGFAIPSDQARKTAEQLIATGKATRPVIGIMMDTSYQGEGVKIEDGPTRGGPADKAGPRAGDVIIKFDGRPVTGLNEFVVPIRAQSVGEEVELTVLRGNSERTVKMTLQAAN